ncbi:MAG: thiamine diphosphokinase [Firmicutes bacterium]|nr:thiamine diphosphokinase [Bacillota bacterium]
MNPIKGSTAFVIGSGEDVPQSLPLEIDGDTLVICADGGAAWARTWGLTPTIIMGDWDSLNEETRDYWQQQRIPMERFPVAKDQTDLDLAVEYALEHGAKEIHLAGGWGSRIDHSLGNVGLLYRLAKAEITNCLHTKGQRLSACKGNFEAKVRVGSTVSLLPLTSTVEEVNTQGLRYPLVDATLTKGSTLSISNEAISENIALRFGEGILLIVFE